jgi:hypothetical protein
MLSGADVYVALNLARQAQGLAPVTHCPDFHATPGPDGLLVLARVNSPTPADPLKIHVDLLWQTWARSRTIDYVAMIWARPRSTPDRDNTQMSRYKFCGFVPIIPDVPTNIDAVLLRKPVIYNNCVISLRVAIAEAGRSPFAFLSGRIRNNEDSAMAAVYVPNWASTTKPTTRPDGTALQVGDRWYAIGTQPYDSQWYAWNGTYWISEQIFLSPFEHTNIGDLSSYRQYAASPGNANMYLRAARGLFYLVNSNPSNYCEFLVQLKPGNTTIATWNTQSIAAGAWTNQSTTLDTFVDLSAAAGLYLQTSIIGSQDVFGQNWLEWSIAYP